jgi:hypothetical protein
MDAMCLFETRNNNFEILFKCPSNFKKYRFGESRSRIVLGHQLCYRRDINIKPPKTLCNFCTRHKFLPSKIRSCKFLKLFSKIVITVYIISSSVEKFTYSVKRFKQGPVNYQL